MVMEGRGDGRRERERERERTYVCGENRESGAQAERRERIARAIAAERLWAKNRTYRMVRNMSCMERL